MSESTAEPSTRPQSHFSALPRHDEWHDRHASNNTIATTVGSNRSSCEPVGADDTFGLPAGDPGVLRSVRSASVIGSTISVASIARSAHASAEEGSDTVAGRGLDVTLDGHGSDVSLYAREGVGHGDLSLVSLVYRPSRHVIYGLVDSPADSARVLVRWTQDRWATMTDTSARADGGRYVFELAVGADEMDCEMALCAIGADGRVRAMSAVDRADFVCRRPGTRGRRD